MFNIRVYAGIPARFLLNFFTWILDWEARLSMTRINPTFWPKSYGKTTAKGKIFMEKVTRWDVGWNFVIDFLVNYRNDSFLVEIRVNTRGVGFHCYSPPRPHPKNKKKC